MNLSDALAQSPTVRRAQSRSKYLEDALASIQASGEKIQSWGELAAKLAALGVTQYSSKKANEGLQEALRNEFQGRQSSLLSQLEGLGGPSPLASPAAPEPAPIAPQAPAPQPGAIAQGPSPLASALGAPPVQQAPPPQAQSVGFRDRNGLASWLQEHVPGARPTSGYRSQSVQDDLVRRGKTRATRSSHTYGLGQDFVPPEGSDWNAIARQLEESGQFGRVIIESGRGRNQGTGAHIHVEGLPLSQRQAPPQAAPPEFSPETNQALQGLGIGLGGQPSAPASVPAQEPPPAPSPQGVGGNPQQQPQQQPNPLGPTPGERQLITQLLSSNRPEDYDRANAMIAKIQERMNAPTQYENATVNGVPGYYNPANPQAGLTPFAIPQQAMNQTRTPQELGMQGAPGTYMSVDPFGKPSTILQPQAGQMVSSQPGQPYQEAPIPGGTRDPTAPMNRTQTTVTGGDSGFQRGTVVSTDATGKPTIVREFGMPERVAASRAFRMQRGMEALNDLAGRGVFKPSGRILFSEQNGLTRLMASDPRDRELVQAMNMYIEPFLRNESGAATPSEEIERYAITWMPQPEDPPEVLWRKAQARADNARGLIANSAGAYESMYPEAPPIRSLAPQVNRGQAPAPGAQGQQVPPPAQRVRGQTYRTPRGPMRWTGTGWVTP